MLSAGVRVYVAAIPATPSARATSFLGGFAGLDPIFGAIVLFIILSLIYTYVGGVKAVNIWTDAAPNLPCSSSVAFSPSFTFPSLLDGGWSEMFRLAKTEDKLHWLNVAVTARSLLENPINIWMGVIGGTFMVLSSHGAEQLIVQRVLACKTVTDGRRALTLSAVAIFPLFLIFLLVGVALWTFYQSHPLQLPVPVVKPGSGLHANDFIFPIFILTETPHLLRGLLIVAILAAAMSSVSSALTALSSVSTMDFVKKWLPERSEDFFLRLSKGLTIGWACRARACGLRQPPCRICLDNSFHPSRLDQRRPPRRLVPCRLLEERLRPRRHLRNGRLLSRHVVDQPINSGQFAHRRPTDRLRRFPGTLSSAAR